MSQPVHIALDGSFYGTQLLWTENDGVQVFIAPRTGEWCNGVQVVEFECHPVAFTSRNHAACGRSVLASSNSMGLIDQYRCNLIRQCVWAVGRTWCWCIESPREVRNKHTVALDAMSSFARTHTAEVLYGHYPLRTKALCIAGRWKSPLVWRAMHTANSLRRLLKQQRMYE